MDYTKLVRFVILSLLFFSCTKNNASYVRVKHCELESGNVLGDGAYFARISYPSSSIDTLSLQLFSDRLDTISIRCYSGMNLPCAIGFQGVNKERIAVLINSDEVIPFILDEEFRNIRLHFYPDAGSIKCNVVAYDRNCISPRY